MKGVLTDCDDQSVKFKKVMKVKQIFKNFSFLKFVYQIPTLPYFPTIK